MTNSGPGRRVTRAYVLGLASMGCVFSGALVLAGWGLWSLLADAEPIEGKETSLFIAPVLVALALGWLFWCMWRLAVALLRGRRTLPWGWVWCSGLGAVLIWGFGGSLLRLDARDAWFSVYPWFLAGAWCIGAVAVWALLFRQVYTDRDQPRWPWELDDALARMVEGPEEEPLAGGNSARSDEDPDPEDWDVRDDGEDRPRQ